MCKSLRRAERVQDGRVSLPAQASLLAPFNIIKESAQPHFPVPIIAKPLGKHTTLLLPSIANHLQSPPITHQSPLKAWTNHLPITSKNGDQSPSNHFENHIKKKDWPPSTHMDNAMVVVSVYCFYTSESFPTDPHVALVL